jgi:mRNA interferase MazF
MTLQRGEIYFVNLNRVQGREQSGQRPVLIISIDAINQLPLVATVIVGTKGENIQRDYPTNVRVSAQDSGLPMEKE